MLMPHEGRDQPLMQLFEGRLDEGGAQQLCRAFCLWLASATRGGRGDDGRLIRQRQLSLAACLGLQESPLRARLALRDSYLRAAAAALPHEGSKAGRLFMEARRFCRHQWPCWLERQQPPSYATDLQRALFYAMKAGGGRLPSTRRQFENILSA